MNNFSVHQLDLMLSFMVYLGYVEDKYQLGVVIEECEEWPWLAHIHDRGDEDGTVRETVWLYYDNAGMISERKTEFAKYGNKRRRGGELSAETEALRQAVEGQEGLCVTLWSGFAMPSFDSLGHKMRNWGLVGDVPEEMRTEYCEKMRIKALMDALLRKWQEKERTKTKKATKVPGGI